MKTLQSKGTRVLKGCSSRQFFKDFFHRILRVDILTPSLWVLILVDMIGNRYIKKVVGGDNPKKGRAKGETTHLKTPVSKWRLVGLDMCPTLRNLVSRLVSGSLFMIRFKGFKSSKTIVLI